MPRGKYVNHKGRSRHFTSPEELQQESDSEEGSSSGEEEVDGEGGTAGASTSKGSSGGKAKKSTKKVGSSSEEEASGDESDEDFDRDAKKGVASLIEIENPNRAVKKATQKVNNISLEGESAKPELTRREREQIEKQKAKMRYDKLHAAGKTSEAKADLARLALIRQQRADAAAKREAEKKVVDDKKGGGKA